MSDLDTMLAGMRDSTAQLTPHPEFISQLHAGISARAHEPPAAFPELPDPMKPGGFSGWPVVLASLLLPLVIAAGLWLWLRPAPRHEPIGYPRGAFISSGPVSPAQRAGARKLSQSEAPLPVPAVGGVFVDASQPAGAPVPAAPTVRAVPKRAKRPCVDVIPPPINSPAQGGAGTDAPLATGGSFTGVDLHGADGILGAAGPVPCKDPQARPPSAPAKPPVGEPAYPFEADTLDGKHVSLKSLRGHVVFIEFWASWCGICWSVVPDLQRLEREHRIDGTVFLSVAYNSEDELRKLTRPHPFPVIADEDQKLGGNFPVRGYPTHVVIDRYGRLLDAAQGVGNLDKTYEKLNAAIATAAAAPKDAPLRTPHWLDGDCEVSGRFMSKSGPASDVHLWLELPGGNGRRIISKDGTFRFTQLACGATFMVSGYAEGYAHSEWAPVRSGDDVTVKMGKLSAMQGVVVNSRGEPAAGATVSSCDMRREHSTTTDAQGHFTLDGLEPGASAPLAVTPPGEKNATEVHARIEEGTTSDVRLQLGERGRARLHIVGVPTHPGALAVDVASVYDCPAAVAVVPVKSGDTLELSLPPGRYTAFAHYEAQAPASDFPQFDVMPDRTAESTVTLGR